MSCLEVKYQTNSKLQSGDNMIWAVTDNHNDNDNGNNNGNIFIVFNDFINRSDSVFTLSTIIINIIKKIDIISHCFITIINNIVITTTIIIVSSMIMIVLLL